MRTAAWQRVIRRTLLLLIIWFIAGPLLGILFVDRLNSVRLGDLPLGFWIAQQGAIYVFVILIFINAWLADRESAASRGYAMDPSHPDRRGKARPPHTPPGA